MKIHCFLMITKGALLLLLLSGAIFFRNRLHSTFDGGFFYFKAIKLAFSGITYYSSRHFSSSLLWSSICCFKRVGGLALKELYERLSIIRKSR